QDPCAVQDAFTPSPFVLDADGVGALRSATLLGGFRMRHTPIQRLSRFRFRLSAMRSGVRILALLGILVFWSTCQAADFACPAGDVACVIDAINTANANGQANTITLAEGTYALTGADNVTDVRNGLPAITSALIIKGAGAAATTITRLDPASPAFRLVHVAAIGSLTLQELTVRGFAVGEGGVGVGGGIRNEGAVTIINGALNGNAARSGGGIFNEGAVTIINSSLSHNGGFEAFASGIYNSAGGMVVLSQSTFSFNGGSHGGAFFNGGTATIIDSTIVSNGGGDSLASEAPIVNSGTLTIMNSTLRDN